MTAKAERKLESSECVKLGWVSVQSQIKFFYNSQPLESG